MKIHARYSGRDDNPNEFTVEALHVNGTSVSGRVVSTSAKVNHPFHVALRGRNKDRFSVHIPTYPGGYTVTFRLVEGDEVINQTDPALELESSIALVQTWRGTKFAKTSLYRYALTYVKRAVEEV